MCCVTRSPRSEAAAPEEGETDRLKLEASRLEHAEAITKSLGTVRSLLRGERGVGELLQDARRGADEAAELDAALRPVVDRLETLAIEVEDIAQEASARDVAPDPQALAVVRDRLGVLASLKRKYGADETAILAYLDEARTRLGRLEDTDSRIEEVERELEEQKAHAAELADRLTDSRQGRCHKVEGGDRISAARACAPTGPVRDRSRASGHLRGGERTGRVPLGGEPGRDSPAGGEGRFGRRTVPRGTRVARS